MTLLGTLIQIGMSLILSIAPAFILKKDKIRISIFLCFAAILSASITGGLPLAILITLILAGYSFWLSLVGYSESGSYRVMFIITVVLSVVFLIQHIIHLPIRIALEQPDIKIASNISGIFLALALSGSSFEYLFNKKRYKVHQQHTQTDSIE